LECSALTLAWGSCFCFCCERADEDFVVVVVAAAAFAFDEAVFGTDALLRVLRGIRRWCDVVAEGVVGRGADCQ